MYTLERLPIGLLVWGVAWWRPLASFLMGLDHVVQLLQLLFVVICVLQGLLLMPSRFIVVILQVTLGVQVALSADAHCTTGEQNLVAVPINTRGRLPYASQAGRHMCSERLVGRLSRYLAIVARFHRTVVLRHNLYLIDVQVRQPYL